MIMGNSLTNRRTSGAGSFGCRPLDRLRFSTHVGPGVRRSRGADADVAQLVAHHLAKVRVAGSSPVVRSDEA
jgi:hypothetical protein